MCCCARGRKESDVRLYRNKYRSTRELESLALFPCFVKVVSGVHVCLRFLRESFTPTDEVLFADQ